MKTIIVIDGNFIGHLSRFGNLVYRKREETGVLHNLLEKVLDLFQVYDTRDICFVWDSMKSHRKRQFSEYKSARKKSRQELGQEEKECLYSMYRQVTKIQDEDLPFLGFNNSFCQNGLEGDDLMAMICRNYPSEKIILVANDHDLYQLLDSKVSLLPCSNNYLGKEYRIKNFVEEFKIEPKQWAMVKAIAGCTSDGVPGCGKELETGKIIARIGEKTACQFLANELKPTTAAHKHIVSAKGAERIKFNKELVELPHKKTKPFLLGENNLNFDNFVVLCKNSKYDDFLEERLDEWKDFFKVLN